MFNFCPNVRRFWCPVFFRVLQYPLWSNHSLVKMYLQHRQCSLALRFEFPVRLPQQFQMTISKIWSENFNLNSTVGLSFCWTTNKIVNLSIGLIDPSDPILSAREFGLKLLLIYPSGAYFLSHESLTED